MNPDILIQVHLRATARQLMAQAAIDAIGGDDECGEEPRRNISLHATFEGQTAPAGMDRGIEQLMEDAR